LKIRCANVEFFTIIGSKMSKIDFGSTSVRHARTDRERRPYQAPRLVLCGSIGEILLGGSGNANEASSAPLFNKRP
jgi:hypothetical protein